VAAGQAREVDLRQGDRVAGARLGPRRPVRHVGELADQLVLALHRLRERALVEREATDPPAPCAVARRDPGLHLENQDPVLRVDDDEVRLAVPRRPAVAHRAEPLCVRVQVEGVGRKGGPDSLGYEALSGLPVRLHATPCRNPGTHRPHGQGAVCQTGSAMGRARAGIS
jgi:hypothetical protein